MELDNNLPRCFNPLLAITIDGFAGSGKGTLAKKLAEWFHVKYLDTGTLYRSAAYALHIDGAEPDNAERAVELIKAWDFDFRHVGNNHFATFLNAQDVSNEIRSGEIGKKSGTVALLPLVREALFDFQVEFATLWRSRVGVVLDGRDTGWRIFPQAECKFFLDADPQTRAQRRHKELVERGDAKSFETTLADVNRRDKGDEINTKAADDAIVIDTGELTIDEVFARAVHHIAAYIEQHDIPCRKPTAA